MNFSTVFLIQIIVTILFSILASIFDVKSGFVPDWLNYLLIAFGLMSNFILTLITSNVKYILASFISMLITYVISYLLWKLHMWGGGDVKLFTSIATAIPFGLNGDIFNIFPLLSIYPFAFTVIFNSILVSFPFLVIFTTYLLFKNKMVNNNVDLLVNVFNYPALRTLIKTTLNKTVKVKDLKEGMIVNRYSFNDEHIFELINDLNGNLKVYKSGDDDYKYYFKSKSAGGLTKEDVNLLKVMCLQKYISDSLYIKISFPFTPAILFGLIIALSYGDLMMLITKNFVLVM
ncbi:prepilin peptidase [uncultured Methanobrevibacter sp.]|uniref:prepilin peptidase n=1 Tax=uncultured Methanobrevibacter sp. TaxID=253161 RepID=UPI0025CEA8FA|nr:A24 family peptidase [uncultured Methanobrevibacter sp.]